MTTTTATTYAKRPARYAKADDHTCTRCILPGDVLEITGPGSALLIATVRPYTHPALVPDGEVWAIADQANGHGITLLWHAWCPFDALPGSLLPCGCWMQVNGDAVLCRDHEAEAVTFTNPTGAPA
ncbi:MAG: hypothetical protein LC721_08645 [Actinobacteria bacterium]|nr:hypothetical protein [Actinomycetota bacterium]